jgi:hypothetical protein
LLTLYIDGELQEQVTFQKPVTLTLDYDVDRLDGSKEETLELRSWADAGQLWSDSGISVLERDPDDHRLMVSISHLTEFALFGVEADRKLYLPIVVKGR